MNRVTEDAIKSKIKGEVYIVMPDARTTLCQLTLENGYTVNGTSACVDQNNFDLNTGRKIAFDDAFNKIWPLEGYLLAEKLYWDAAVSVATNSTKKKSEEAPYGYKADGTPRKRPGRPMKKARK